MQPRITFWVQILLRLPGNFLVEYLSFFITEKMSDEGVGIYHWENLGQSY